MVNVAKTLWRRSCQATAVRVLVFRKLSKGDYTGPLAGLPVCYYHTICSLNLFCANGKPTNLARFAYVPKDKTNHHSFAHSCWWKKKKKDLFAFILRIILDNNNETQKHYTHDKTEKEVEHTNEEARCVYTHTLQRLTIVFFYQAPAAVNLDVLLIRFYQLLTSNV